MKKNLILAVLLPVIGVSVMMYIEAVIKPVYLYKSLLKIFVFSSVAVIYSLVTKEKIIDLIRIRKRLPSRKLILAMIFVYLFILCVYFLLHDRIDLSNIRNSLLAKEGLTRDNFIFIFSYIIVINSFLEEALFRGFLYTVFADRNHPVSGAVFSSLLFAVYHLGIVFTWFDPLILILCITGLAGTGLFLQYICIREDNLFACWFVHACANLAINTIGAFMILQ
ncbi:MAG: CPBP family intramembrane metalloprotease [Solobacterium sp.]|nr:CPBP family intramembrane metalloprotease [Solobacterium sp.]